MSASDDNRTSLDPREALRWASHQLETSGIDSHARDGRILLRHVLDCTEEQLAGGNVAPLLPAQVAALRGLIKRRRQGEPIAYIVGKKEFMALEFAVDRRVLIPRPETELLVEKALDLFACDGEDDRVPQESPRLNEVSRPLIADIGTGSGAIAVSIAKYLPHAIVYATDIASEALAVARKNAAAHGVAERLVLLQGSYLQALPQAVHMVVCNPPYIPQGEIPGLDRDVREFEPRIALTGGSDGLDAYRRLFAELPASLLPGGIGLFEIGFDMAAPLRKLAARRLPGAHCEVFQDLAGFDRILQVSQVAPTGRSE